MKLINILKEGISSSKYELIDQKVSELMRTNPPDSMNKLLDKITLICASKNVSYDEYISWLRKNRLQ